MSSLLDHLDNNHSDDDEDDHINRLFPKCKPRASSLSLSPSMQPFGDESTSTSTSDSQLPTSEIAVSFAETKNLNINYRHTNQLNHSSYRRHSSNATNCNYEESQIVQNSGNHCEREDLSAQQLGGQTFTQYYENNNFNSGKNPHFPQSSTLPLGNSKSYSGNLGKGSIPLPTNSKSRKSESNHFHHSHHQHPQSRSSTKGSRREHSNSNNSAPFTSHHHHRHHRNNNNSSATNHNSYEVAGRIEKLKVGPTSPSFISTVGKGKSVKGGQRDKGREKLLNCSNSSGKSPSSLSLASHGSIAGMECDTLDDHFDNGIGSGGSGSGSSSGGSNSHSNGSAFSENALTGSVSVGSMAQPPVGGGSLRDSRIEIAGGREIFSQNRIRAGRRLRGSSSTSSSTEMMADPSINSTSTTPSNKLRRKSPNSNPHQYPHLHHQQIGQGSSNSSNMIQSSSVSTATSPPASSITTSQSVWEPNNSAGSVSGKKSLGLNFKGTGSHRHHSHGHGFSAGVHQQSHVKSRHGHNYGHGYDYSKSFDLDVIGGGVRAGFLPQVHATSPSALTMKETVFSTEITSIEKPVSGGGASAFKSPKMPQEGKSPTQVEAKQPFIYETPMGGGEIVFDDIEDWHEEERREEEEEAREVDYEGEEEEENEHDDEDDNSSRERERRRIRNRSPQSQLHLLEVLMKDSEGKVSDGGSSSVKHHNNSTNTTNVVGLLEGSPCPSNPGGNTTPSGYESDECSASASAITASLTPTNLPLKTSPNSGNKRLIGNIPIAEYEGSPKRYGLRQPCHPMPTHLDLVDVGIELTTDSHRSAHVQTAQSLQSQMTPAPTSSSSSSLDNTNTLASSNSSSRNNYNRISPRVLSPSQSLSGFPPKVPGFPQRVTSAPGVSSSDPVSLNNTSAAANTSGTTTHPANMDRESNEDLAKLPISDSRNGVLTENLDGGESKLAPVSNLTSDLIIGQLNVKLGTTDLSPDDSVASQQGSNNTTSSTSSEPDPDLDRRRQPNKPIVDTNDPDDMLGNRRNLPLSLTTSTTTASTITTEQDYLYEFSETRKVLEEFFKVSPHLVKGNVHGTMEGNEISLPGDRPHNFDELDYTLKRQAGNSYVGQRLAGECAIGGPVEESPKKPPRRGIVLLGDGGGGSGGGLSPRLISFQEVTLPPMHSLSLSMHSHSHSHLHSHSRSRSSRSPRSPTSQSRSESHSPSSQDPSRDVNDNDIDAETTSTNTETDLGDTEVGLQVGHSRNFTLSPETTDCDSNELESEISLDYEASVHSSSRVGATMPVLEDGLSSGNVSENDDVTGNDGSNSGDTGCTPGSRKRLPNSSSSRKLLGLSNSAGSGIPTASSLCPLGVGGNNTNTVSTNTHSNAGTQSVVSGNLSSTIGNSAIACNSTTASTPSEANPTLLLMKKQISEIEKEIKLRASQQCQRLQAQQQATNSLVDTNGSSNGGGGINANGTSAPPPPTTMSSAIATSLECNNSVPSGNAGRGANNLLGTRVGIGDTVAVGGVSLGIAAIVEDGFSDSSSRQENSIFDSNDPELEALDPMRPTPPPSPAPGSVLHHHNPIQSVQQHGRILNSTRGSESGNSCSSSLATNSTQASGANGNGTVAVVGLDTSNVVSPDSSGSSAASSSSSSVAVAAAIQDIKDAIQRTKSLPQQRQFDHPVNSSTSTTATTASAPTSSNQLRGSEPRELHQQSSQERLPPLVRDSSPVWVPRQPTTSGNHHHHHRSANAGVRDPLLRKQRYEETPDDDADTDQETDRLLGQNRTDDDYGFYDDKEKDGVKKKRSKEVLIEGVLFRARYLGSTQLVCEGQPTKATRMMQAEEAVSRIKAPEGETQPSTEVDLFISTEKIMVLNTDLKEIMMDHALRTISYIADIGDLVVLMARRRPVPTDTVDESKIPRPPKMICHVFESDEAQYIAQSIGQAFQVAYMEFLKANGIEDHSFVREMDYQEVLNSQEIFGDELQMFAKKELQKEVVVPKTKGEILGVVIVESGWGSMLPTVVIANLAPAGAAARCGQLNIGDQIIAINGVSLVGLPLSTCQNYIKNTKTQTVVKLTVVPCPPVVEVKIKRPDTKYQLGFSVQNGVICSLLRGGIAERGGVRVGHRIIEINNQSVVAVPHEKIVNLLATSVGEINMKTMPTSMFRLLTGQETPLYI